MSDTSTSEYTNDSDESTAESEVEMAEVVEKESLKTQTLTLCVTEMTCPNSCLRIKRFLNVLPGVICVKLSQIIQQCQVTFHSTVISEKEIIEKISTKGFSVRKMFAFDVEGQFVINYEEGSYSLISQYLLNKGVKILSHNDEQRQIQVFAHSPRQLIKNCIAPVSYQFNNYGFLREVLTHKSTLLYHKFILLLGTIPFFLMVALYVVSWITAKMGDPLSLNFPLHRALTVKNIVLSGLTIPVMLVYFLLLFKNVRHFMSLNIMDENVVVMICIWISYFSSVFSIGVESFVQVGVYDTKMDFFLEQAALVALLHEFGKFFEIITNKRVGGWMVKLMERYENIMSVKLITNVTSDEELRELVKKKKKKRKKRKKKRRKLKEIEIEATDKNFVFRYDYIEVKSGDIIPYDGTVIALQQSESTSGGQVNQIFFDEDNSMVEKHPGDTVLAGSRNIGCKLYIKVTKKHACVLSKVIGYAMSSQLDDFSHFSSKIFNLFVPLTSILTFTNFILMVNFAYYFFGYSGEPSGYIFELRTTGYLFALFNSINIIYVASPCAWSQFGVLVRSVVSECLVRCGYVVTRTNFLRTLGEIEYVVMNKCGVVTEGKYSVKKMKKFSQRKSEHELSRDEIKRCVVSIERYLKTSIARALVKYCKSTHDDDDEDEQEEEIIEDYEVYEVKNMYHTPGRGVKAEVTLDKELEEIEVVIGSLDYMSQNDIRVKKRKKQKEEGATNVYVAIAGRLVAAFVLENKIRPEIHEVVSALKKMDKKVVLVTGDNEAAARRCCDEVNMDEFFYGLPPKDKANLIGEYQEKGKKVLFVGNDTITDRAVIQAADLSISTRVKFDTLVQPDLYLLKNNMRFLMMPFDLQRKMNVWKTLHLLVVLLYHVLAFFLVSGWATSYMGIFIPNFVCAALKIIFNFSISFVAVMVGKTFKNQLSKYEFEY